jgi:23S rRNA (cytidine2498-2'-O)-methyltransferase
LASIIFTSQEDSWDLAQNEIMKTLPDSQFRKWLTRGVGIASSPLSFDDAALLIKERNVIFTRHIFPLEYECSSSAWSNAIGSIAARLEEARAKTQVQTYSIQLRILDPSLYSYSKHDLTQWMSEDLQKRVFAPELENPDFVISAVLSDFNLYMGLSSPAQNLSSWAGGMRRYERRPDQISRAEFKLLEALETFGLDLSSLPGNKALDLGAAPGGWTKVLSSKGFSVTAVDPAALSPAVLELGNIVHAPMAAQRFLATTKGEFDLLANDMRMDASDSAKITASFSERLSVGGAMIMTLKLPQRKPKDAMDKALAILRRSFSGIRAKQLFHNRSEVTVFGVKSASQK